MDSLQTKDLSYSVDQADILLNINAEIPLGSMTAIMGLNGAGKTTLLRVLSSYLTPSKGLVFLSNANIHKIPTKQLAKTLSYVPQDFPTDFPFTVYELVMMGRFAWQKGLFHEEEDHKKVLLVLRDLNLLDFKDRMVSSLSGGEKQRVLLARAVVQEAPVILLDEPVNHLDIKNKVEILKLLKKQNEQHHKTIVAVMHDFSDVRRYFDRVLFLKNGHLVFQGEQKKAFEPERLAEVFETEVKDFF